MTDGKNRHRDPSYFEGLSLLMERDHICEFIKTPITSAITLRNFANLPLENSAIRYSTLNTEDRSNLGDRCFDRPSATISLRMVAPDRPKILATAPNAKIVITATLMLVELLSALTSRNEDNQPVSKRTNHSVQCQFNAITMQVNLRKIDGNEGEQKQRGRFNNQTQAQ